MAQLYYVPDYLSRKAAIPGNHKDVNAFIPPLRIICSAKEIPSRR